MNETVHNIIQKVVQQKNTILEAFILTAHDLFIKTNAQFSVGDILTQIKYHPNFYCARLCVDPHLFVTPKEFIFIAKLRNPLVRRLGKEGYENKDGMQINMRETSKKNAIASFIAPSFSSHRKK